MLELALGLRLGGLEVLDGLEFLLGRVKRRLRQGVGT